MDNKQNEIDGTKKVIKVGLDPLGMAVQREKLQKESEKSNRLIINKNMTDLEKQFISSGDHKLNKKTQKQISSLALGPRKVNFQVPDDQKSREQSMASSGIKEQQQKLPTVKDSDSDFQILSSPSNKDTNVIQFEEIKPDTDEQVYEFDTDNKNIEIDRDMLLKKGVKRDQIYDGEEFISSSIVDLKLNDKSCNQEKYYLGELILTTYQVIFLPSDRSKHDELEALVQRNSFFYLPLGYILKISRSSDKKGINYSYIEIVTKDFREYCYRYQQKHFKQSEQFLYKVMKYAFPGTNLKEQLFAFKYFKYNSSLEKKWNGWKIYDIDHEFKRQRIGYEIQGLNDHQFETNTLQKECYYKYLDNRDGNICSTYPEFLVVPAKIDDQNIRESTKFRSRERIPVLSYAYKRQQLKVADSEFSTLWRSSQCRAGFQLINNNHRSYGDERFLRLIGDPKDINREAPVDIFDARPYIAAFGNQIQGKGYESKENYRNCSIQFLDIENIHKVRDSMKILVKTIHTEPNKFLSNLQKSNYLDIIQSILIGAQKITDSLVQGRNVLVHCSDGWDRTSQLCCLAQILLDPYFRKIEGFMVLVEKDFISFGHQFSLRSGIGCKNYSDDQRSPVFFQFLDCIHQIINQFPLSFEYNELFLMDIANHINSCLFGTFLCNSIQDQIGQFFEIFNFYIENRVREYTISLWSYLLERKEMYLNPFYQEADFIQRIQPVTDIQSLKVWKLFMLYVPGHRDRYRVFQECLFTEDNIQVAHKYQKMKYEQIFNELKSSNNKIKELEEKIQYYEKKEKQQNGRTIQSIQIEKQNSTLSPTKISPKSEKSINDILQSQEDKSNITDSQFQKQFREGYENRDSQDMKINEHKNYKMDINNEIFESQAIRTVLYENSMEQESYDINKNLKQDHFKQKQEQKELESDAAIELRNADSVNLNLAFQSKELISEQDSNQQNSSKNIELNEEEEKQLSEQDLKDSKIAEEPEQQNEIEKEDNNQMQNSENIENIEQKDNQI